MYDFILIDKCQIKFPKNGNSNIWRKIHISTKAPNGVIFLHLEVLHIGTGINIPAMLFAFIRLVHYMYKFLQVGIFFSPEKSYQIFALKNRDSKNYKNSVYVHNIVYGRSELAKHVGLWLMFWAVHNFHL